MELDDAHFIRLPRALETRAVYQLASDLKSVQSLPGGTLLVVTGAEADTFCEGLALDIVTDGCPDEIADAARAFQSCLHSLDMSPVPVVGIADGPALGGGLGLLAACDVVLASPAARFGLPELVMGLPPALILPFLDKRMRQADIGRWALSGVSHDVAEARAAGLVDDLIAEPGDDGARIATIRRWQRRLGRASSEAISEFRQLLSQSRSPQYDDIALRRLTKILADPALQRAWQRFAEEGVPPWSPE